MTYSFRLIWILYMTIALLALTGNFQTARAEHTSEGHVIGGVMMTSVCMMMKRHETLGFQHVPDWLCIASPFIMAYFKEQYFDPPHASNREDMIEWAKGGLLAGGMIKIYERKF